VKKITILNKINGGFSQCAYIFITGCTPPLQGHRRQSQKFH